MLLGSQSAQDERHEVPAFEIIEQPLAHAEPAESAADEIGLLREMRLFRARVIEATEAAVETLVADIAADVLARELLLTPADVETIVDRALQRFLEDEPLRVRVHAGDAPKLECGVPVVADDTLRRGDAVIELRTGTIDARLGVRLATLLQATA
jgi:flagellar biosynthesis/type III secretory pathway protein FliH